MLKQDQHCAGWKKKHGALVIPCDEREEGGEDADNDPDGEEGGHVQERVEAHQHAEQKKLLQLSGDRQKVPHRPIRLAKTKQKRCAANQLAITSTNTIDWNTVVKKCMRKKMDECFQ